MGKINLRFLIIGLGSMGKRRIRNLFFNKQHQIIGYDILPERRAEVREKYGIKIINNLKEISGKDFEVMIISTPPNAHGDYIRMAIRDKKHFFVEHPVSDDGYKEIFKQKKSNIVMAPSCTLRYFTPIKMIKNILQKRKIGKILAFQYHMGQYLPDWHPWEDYRRVYFSKKETGACREMLPFELIWINWLLNSEVIEVCGYIEKISNLDMEADDIIMANLKYKNGIIGNIIIDVVARKPFRTLRILGSTGVLEWEKFDSLIKIFNIESKKSQNIKISKSRPMKNYINEEKMYNNEIGAFINAIREKKKYPHTFNNSLRLLRVLYALEKSNKTGRVVSLKDYGKKN